MIVLLLTPNLYLHSTEEQIFFDSHIILIVILLTNLYMYIFMYNIVLLSANFQRSISQPARHTEKQQLIYNKKQVNIKVIHNN